MVRESLNLSVSTGAAQCVTLEKLYMHLTAMLIMIMATTGSVLFDSEEHDR